MEPSSSDEIPLDQTIPNGGLGTLSQRWQDTVMKTLGENSNDENGERAPIDLHAFTISRESFWENGALKNVSKGKNAPKKGI
jgi:hypothetical protein